VRERLHFAFNCKATQMVSAGASTEKTGFLKPQDRFAEAMDLKSRSHDEKIH